MIALLLLLILLGNSVTSLLTQSDINQSLNLVNKERRKFKLQPVIFNSSIQHELEQIPDNYWFNTTLNQTHTFQLGDQTRVRPYNLYFHKPTPPFRYLFHDTVKTTMSSIVSPRLKQRDCFKLKKCNTEEFEMYYSCGGKPNQIKDGGKCSWFFHYYPRMVIKSLSEIACVLPNIEGPNVPTKLKGIQKKVFICYGVYDEPTTDNPLLN